MRNFSRAVLTVLVMVGFAAVGAAQNAPRGTSTITLNGKKVSVEYGRPSLKGRTSDEMLGELPAGGVWRLGADTSTTFSTDGDLDFVDGVVPAGTYSLWLGRAAGGNSWNLVFNKQHGQWGTKHDASLDAVSVPLNGLKAPSPVETLTITLRKSNGGGVLDIQWGTLQVVASFKAK